MWQVLCEEYFQRFIPADSTVLEIAAGYCEFINNISAKRRIAVDINKETLHKAHPEVEVIISASTDLSVIENDGVDVVFVSNFFEHISKEDIVQTVKECRRCLKSGGHLLILQPNIRYVQKDYWMFFDHITPIDDRALCELLEVIGFKIKLILPKFLPYTTKSRLPKSLGLLRIYLKLPILYKIFGGQAFIVAKK
jgi:ubiquinone/menaquinone biosynthesis C-methylase UbiE